MLTVAVCALCLGAQASGSPALARPLARAAAERTGSQRSARIRHPASCAQQSSFHARKRQHRQRRARCVRRRPATRHTRASHRGRRRSRHPLTHRARSHHVRSHAPAPGASRRLAPNAAVAPNAANSDACPNASLTPTAQNIESVRAATLCLINRERTANGERPLQPVSTLQLSAQRHTDSMAYGNYFEHDGPDGTPASRMRASGYIYSPSVGYEIGENIGWGTLWLATPHAIVAAWMASPGHRANILDSSFHDTGIGVSAHPPESLARGEAGAIYTQDFGVIITG
ncbi:MAG TPA: CAP domain-containing protein [Solirubrobacteraceae bacterium]|nr:CAP domain-containing protein [Solirubrobacteraceae bacterium]